MSPLPRPVGDLSHRGGHWFDPSIAHQEKAFTFFVEASFTFGLTCEDPVFQPEVRCAD